MHLSARSLGVAAAGAVAVLALRPDTVDAGAGKGSDTADLQALRRQGPAALEPMLAEWDRTAPGPARDRLALAIDTVAAQRYATVSRLYWYTDLGEAQRAARALDRPILALRMLGRLDEDLSCANSRFFRTMLYANASVSKLLREKFVLYWSSERNVPRVTIDFGDGRKLERTTTGNSAHYILDANARPVDVLPGLYAPMVFRDELETSARLARDVRNLSDDQLRVRLLEHHRRELEAGSKRFAAAGGQDYIRGRRRLLRSDEMGADAVRAAQVNTMAKMVVEVPDLGKIGIDAGAIPTDDTAQWSALGQRLWKVFLPPAARNSGRVVRPPAPATVPSVLLDAPSRALIERLHNAGPVKSDAAGVAAMIARFEQHVLGDTALNEHLLRPQIRWMFAQGGKQTLDGLNTAIYANVFRTPKSDAWLGLLSRTDFTGLPGDGATMP